MAEMRLTNIMNDYPEQQNPSLLVTTDMHRRALQLAQWQTSPAEAQQVYGNSLAVSAIAAYFRILNISSEIPDPNELHPLLTDPQRFAMLDLPEFGQLECRWSEQPAIAPAAELDRLGTVVVQFQGELAAATELEILGFTTQASEQIAVENLRSLPEFLGYLEQLATVPPGFIAETAALQEVLTRSQVSIDMLWRQVRRLWEKEKIMFGGAFDRLWPQLLGVTDNLSVSYGTKELPGNGGGEQMLTDRERRDLNNLGFAIEDNMAEWLQKQFDEDNE
jgi:hypothetical protein